MSTPGGFIPFEATLDQGPVDVALTDIGDALVRLQGVTTDVSTGLTGDFDSMLFAIDNVVTRGLLPLNEAFGKLGAAGESVLPNVVGQLRILIDTLEQTYQGGEQASAWVTDFTHLLQLLSDTTLPLGQRLMEAQRVLSLFAMDKDASDALTRLSQAEADATLKTQQLAEVVGTLGGQFLIDADTFKSVWDTLDKLTQQEDAAALSASRLAATLTQVGTQSLLDVDAIQSVASVLDGLLQQEQRENEAAQLEQEAHQRLVDTLFTNVDTMQLADEACQRLIESEQQAMEAANQERLAVEREQAAHQALVDTLFQNAETESLMEGAVQRTVAAIAEEGSWVDKLLLQIGQWTGAIDVNTSALDRQAAAEQNAATKAQDLADKEGLADDHIRSFGQGALGFLGTMAGFTVITDAANALGKFGKMAFDGNVTVEKLTAQLTTLLGSGGAAQQLVDWTFKFGQTAPFTTQSIQQAAVTVASLGVNTQQVLPELAKAAAAMGVDMPTAANAMLDAMKENRFLMLQRNLRISKTDLEQFGMQVEKNGHVIDGTFLPAFMKLVEAKYPNALNTAMHTFWGETSNATDQLQQLAIAFGQPIFETFKSVLFDLVTWMQQNHQMLTTLGRDVGQVVANALQFLVTLLRETIQLFQQHHQLVYALAGALSGALFAGLRAVLGLLVPLISSLIGAAGPFVLLGAAISLIVPHLVDLYNHSENFRALIAQIAGFLQGAFAAALNTAKGLLQDVVTWFSNLFDHTTKVVTPIKDVTSHLRDLNDGIGTVGDKIKGFATSFQNWHGPLGNAKTDLQNILNPLQQFVSWLEPVPAHTEKVAVHVAATHGGLAALNDGMVKAAGGTGKFTTEIVKVPAQSSGFQQFLTTVPGFLQRFWQGVQRVGDVLGQTFAPMIVLVQGVLATIVPALLPVGQAFLDLGSSVMTQLGPTWQMLVHVVQDDLVPAWFSFVHAMQPLLPLFQALGVLLGGAVVATLAGLVGGLHAAISGLGEFLRGVIQVIGGVIQFFSGLFETVVYVFKAIGDASTLLKDLFSGNWKAVIADLANLASDFAHIWEGVQNMLAGVWEVIKGLFRATIGTILALVGGFIAGVLDFIGHLVDNLVGGHGKIPQMLDAWVKFFDNLPGNILTSLGNLWNTLVGWFNNLGGQFQTWGRDMISNLIDGLANMLPNLGGFLRDHVASAIKGILGFSVPEEGPLSDADTWMPHFGDLLSEGLRAQQSRIAAAAHGVAGALAGGMGLSNTTGTANISGSSGLVGGVSSSAGTGTGTMQVTINLNGGIADGWRMLNASQQHDFAQLIGQELGKQAFANGPVAVGYSGAW